MAAEYTQDKRPLRVYTPLGDNVLLLEEIEGEESISRPFEYRLQMVSLNDAISADDLIRKPVHVEVDLADGSQRYFHGLVSNFIQRGRRQVLTGYTAVVRPWFWFLSLYQDSIIFQNKSVTDIVEQVFKDHSYTDFTLKTYGTYSPRDYCVQYRESCMDFVSRLLEEEGIFYYFEHSKEKHNLVITDKVTGCDPCAGQSTYKYEPQAGSFFDEDVVTEIEQEVRANTSKVTLNDYNFETPSTNLQASSSGKTPEELYDYPGKYEKKDEGTAYADVRLEEQEAPVTIVRGASNGRSLAAGYKFDLDNYYNRKVNANYLLTRVNVLMKTNAYTTNARPRDDFRTTFEAVPSSITYRPARVTPKPVISGVQTAVVVGTSGEEIYVDKYGRVKVQFFWDRKGQKNENSSCWVRVSQDWAGKNWGSVFIPRIGQEVIVDFLEGDPDRPIITGRVYNAEQMPPYDLPGNMTQSGVKTRSSKGGGTSNYNEFRFEDKMGSEDILLHAEKDFHIEVENDEDRKVQHDRTTYVKNNHTETVDLGNQSVTLNTGNQTTEIKQGNRSVTIDMGNQTTTLKMGNQNVELNMGNRSIKVDLGQISEEAMQSIELKVGPSSIKIDPMSITLQAMMIKIQGTIQVQVQGVMVQVNGDAMVQIQGGITMIN
jgi:type VI secretion system secreted protein VgrG